MKIPLNEAFALLKSALDTSKEVVSRFSDEEYAKAVKEIYGYEPEYKELDLLAEVIAKATDISTNEKTELLMAITEEIDDAVSIQVTDKGYVLGVHIADCAAFVADGTSLAESALEHGTSIYFPGYSVPMFPVEISHDICSLTEGVDKRVVSMMINYDLEGNVVTMAQSMAKIREELVRIQKEIFNL